MMRPTRPTQPTRPMTAREFTESQTPLIRSYYVGLDLGKARDFTAVAVLEEPLWLSPALQRELNAPQHAGWVSPAALAPWQVATARNRNYHRPRPPSPPLSLRHLERFPLGTRYPVIVERVAHLMHTPPLAGDAWLVADATGVGAPVTDEFRKVLRNIADVTITGGTTVGVDVDSTYRYTVPKRDLVSTLQALLQSDRLKIAAGLPEAGTLVDELLAFEVSVSEAAHDTYEGRKGAHDDLVLAVAMACWFRGYQMTNVDRAHARHAARESAATEV